MTTWRPALSEFLAAMREPAGWAFDTDGFAEGIDNVHVDVHLSPRFRDLAVRTVRNLIAEELMASARHAPVQLVSANDLERFRRRYTRLFESVLERDRSALSDDLLALLQLSLLRWMLGVAERENHAIQEDYQRARQESLLTGSGRNLQLHEQLVLLKRHGSTINRRVLKMLFRQIRKLEAGPLSRLRSSVSTEVWPFPQQAFFNPLLMTSDPGDAQELAAEYPVASLGEIDGEIWLQRANQILMQVFSEYVPDFCRRQPRGEMTPRDLSPRARERRDQGLLRGFLSTELLLSRVLSDAEYRSGQISWLDEPANLRRFLHLPDVEIAGDPDPGSSSLLWPAQWASPQWQAFRAKTRAQLHQRLESVGTAERIVLCYLLPTLRAQIGAPVPLSLIADYARGRLPRRRLESRLRALDGQIDLDTAIRALDRCHGSVTSMNAPDRAPYLDRFLGDFLVLRRDLKLAYKTYEAMDRLRLLESDDEISLSRSNGTLYEFVDRKESAPLQRRIRSHAVVKADIRGSTFITDELAARGLNPASHFSLNLFNPVNKLLPEFGAEKLFVEGDAVIMSLYEYEDRPGSATGVHPVARACGLARGILQVVALQNVQNRKHGLPELELGLGIAFSPREPNFLYDEGRRIMISSAINNADRLSSCASVLRSAGVRPPGEGQRVVVVRSASASVLGSSDGDRLLAYNVNGIRLEQTAFFQLQREISFRQARLSLPGDDDGLYFLGSDAEALGRDLHIAVRCAPVRDWNGRDIGGIEPEHRHYFEVIVDESISAALRKQTR
ncbi:MAG: hypothetical protein WBG92_20295 [Thiohalocapsa sp.]